MRTQIIEILQKKYPAEYSMQHIDTADEILRLVIVNQQSEQLKCDNCKCTPTVIHNTPSGRFCEACRPVTL